MDMLDRILLKYAALGVVAWAKRGGKFVIYTVHEPSESEKHILAATVALYSTYDAKDVEFVTLGQPIRALGLGLFRETGNPKAQIQEELRPGISVGHEDITAGTLGQIVEINGEPYILSNAHVLTPNPFLPPEKIVHRRIIQPGPYDINFDEDMYDDLTVAEYTKHVKLHDVWEEPPECPISQAINWLYAKLGRISRLYTVTLSNRIDAAIARIYKGVVWSPESFGGLPSDDMRLVGLLFAGNDSIVVGCKIVKYLSELDPRIEFYVDIVEDVGIRDKVAKDGRTTCCTVWSEDKPYEVIEPSASVVVNYGHGYVAWFEDVFFVRNYQGTFGQPGDSGSPIFVMEV